jgi:hypothetical protein
MLKMQPTFTFAVPVSADEAMAEIRNAIESPSLREYAQSAGRCVDYTISKQDQRFWSPHLSVQLSETDSGSSLLGRFSPRPEIWTMFMAFYFFAAFAACGAAIYGYAQWALGGAPWALIGIPIGIVVILVLHVASMIGQNLSSDQMELLRSRLDHTLEIAFDEPATSTDLTDERTKSSD